MMDRVSQKSPATDYTVQFSVYQFIAMGVGGLGMTLAGRMGYEGAIYIALGGVILGAITAINYVAKQDN